MRQSVDVPNARLVSRSREINFPPPCGDKVPVSPLRALCGGAVHPSPVPCAFLPFCARHHPLGLVISAALGPPPLALCASVHVLSSWVCVCPVPCWTGCIQTQLRVSRRCTSSLFHLQPFLPTHPALVRLLPSICIGPVQTCFCRLTVCPDSSRVNALHQTSSHLAYVTQPPIPTFSSHLGDQHAPPAHRLVARVCRPWCRHSADL